MHGFLIGISLAIDNTLPWVGSISPTQAYIITEAGDFLTTEDGDRLITE